MQAVEPFPWRIGHYIRPDLGWECHFGTFTVMHGFILMEMREWESPSETSAQLFLGTIVRWGSPLLS